MEHGKVSFTPFCRRKSYPMNLPLRLLKLQKHETAEIDEVEMMMRRRRAETTQAICLQPVRIHVLELRRCFEIVKSSMMLALSVGGDVRREIISLNFSVGGSEVAKEA